MIALRRGLWIVAALLAVAAPARGVPPYARRYGMTCSTCHVGGPNKLTSFGEAFRDNGYRIPGETDDYVREPPVPLGDASRAALFPRAMWPGELAGSVPIGGDGSLRLSTTLPSPASGNPSTFAFSPSVALFLAGSPTEHLALFAEVSVSTTGAAAAQLFGVARSLFQRWLGESALNLKVGRMKADLFAVISGFQTSSTRPLPMAVTVGKDGFALGNTVDGVELYGLIAGRVKWMVAGANGVKPLDDLQTRRDLLGRVAVKLGGERLDLRGGNRGAEEATALSIGAGGYWGESVFVPTAPAPRIKNEIIRLVGDLRLRTHGVDLLAMVVLGQDGDPDGVGKPVRHVAWSAGADLAAFPWCQFYGRFEEARFDDPARPDRRRVVVGTALFLRTNVRFRIEGAIGLVDAEPHQILFDSMIAL